MDRSRQRGGKHGYHHKDQPKKPQLKIETWDSNSGVQGPDAFQSAWSKGIVIKSHSQVNRLVSTKCKRSKLFRGWEKLHTKHHKTVYTTVLTNRMQVVQSLRPISVLKTRTTDLAGFIIERVVNNKESPVWVHPVQPRGCHSTELSYLSRTCPWSNIYLGQDEEDACASILCCACALGILLKSSSIWTIFDV